MTRKVYITGRGMITAAGKNPASNWVSFCLGQSGLSFMDDLPVGKICGRLEEEFSFLRRDKLLKLADRSALLGVVAAHQAILEGGTNQLDNTMVVMGCTRGPTECVENSFRQYLESSQVDRYISIHTSTTSISSAIAYQIGATGASFAISSACTSAIQAIGMASLALQSGHYDKAVVGGAEAPLTPFVVEQFKTVGILKEKKQTPWPYRPLHSDWDGPAFGEGGACLLLETNPTREPIAVVSGYGAAIEDALKPGLRDDAIGLQVALHQAIRMSKLEPKDIDLVIGHGTATKKGEEAEFTAYRQVFGEQLPIVSFNKWLCGHLLGAGGAVSAVLACSHIEHDFVPGLPYFAEDHPHGKSWNQPINHVAVVTMGYGGNAGVVIMSKP